MKRKREKSGLTLVEILVVLAIIALLAGILIPAITAVKDAAKEAKQKAQFTAIDIGLTAFRNDYGDYPSSGHTPPPSPPYPLRPVAGGVYCGAQRLSEALLGLDLLGFHPKSAWWWDGLDIDAAVDVYDPARDLSERKGPYLESGTQNAFTLAELFPSYGIATARGANRHVICDIYGATRVTTSDGTVVKAGAPVLYYKANRSGKTIQTIYSVLDNLTILTVKEPDVFHPLADPDPPVDQYEFFYGDGFATGDSRDQVIGYIEDPKIGAKVWPYNPKSYILISAGADGIYGTEDDIRNFGN